MLRGVRFSEGTAILDPSSGPLISQIAGALARTPGQFLIEAHVDGKHGATCPGALRAARRRGESRAGGRGKLSDAARRGRVWSLAPGRGSPIQRPHRDRTHAVTTPQATEETDHANRDSARPVGAGDPGGAGRAHQPSRGFGGYGGADPSPHRRRARWRRRPTSRHTPRRFRFGCHGRPPEEPPGIWSIARRASRGPGSRSPGFRSRTRASRTPRFSRVRPSCTRLRRSVCRPCKHRRFVPAERRSTPGGRLHR